MKRWICLILTAALMLGCVRVGAAADFKDVAGESWYHEAVEYAVSNKLMNGVGDERFAPDTEMSRAMLVTVLWRYAGAPVDGANVFVDVEAGQWYTEAVAWAAKNEIVGGVGGARFDPDGMVTREQLAAVLCRYCASLGLETGKQVDLSTFPDEKKISSWATIALSWAVAEGLITGSKLGDKAYLEPQGNATRAQVATILMRFIEEYLKNACPHEVTNLIGQKEPTCAGDGYTGDDVCEKCRYCTHKGEVVAKLGHDYGEDGVCTVCGEKQNDERLTVGENTYRLGMSLAELSEMAGEPAEILTAINGLVWHVYGTGDYTSFFMAGVQGETVIGLCAAGAGFVYREKKMGDTVPEVTGQECALTLSADRNDNDIFVGVRMISNSFVADNQYTEHTLYAESKMNFYLTNAFRVYHEKAILTWDDLAATSARLHSEDMMNNDYFSHTGLNDSTPGDRMKAQGISWRAWSENICAGYDSAFAAFDGWVNSAPHREGMLDENVTHLGVGFAANPESRYRIYATQNFFA